MRRPEPTRRQVERLITSAQFKYRFEFVLEFDRPISVLKGREATRKILDALEAHSEADVPEGFAQASLRCSELKRLVKIRVVPPKREG
jgi:hypothetical protein